MVRAPAAKAAARVLAPEASSSAGAAHPAAVKDTDAADPKVEHVIFPSLEASSFLTAISTAAGAGS